MFVGNEGWSYSNIVKLPVERKLHQTFSLLGQPREKVKPLARFAGRGRIDRRFAGRHGGMEIFFRGRV